MLNMVGKVLAFVTSLAIAYFFGSRATTDIYFYAIATLTAVVGLFSSLNATLVIPEAMRLTEQVGSDASERFVNFFLFCYVAIGVLLTAVAALSPVDFYAFLSKFDRTSLEANRTLLVLSVPLLPLMLTTTFLVDVLTSKRYFTLPTLVNILNNILALFSILLFHSTFGLESILAGLLFAYFLQLVWLLHIMVGQLHWHFRFERPKWTRSTKVNMVYAQLGIVSAALAGYLPIYWMTSLAAGDVTALSFAQRLMDLPNALIITQVSSVVGIKFNELHGRREYENLDHTFVRASKAMVFVLVPIALFLSFFSREIVGVLFERGSFDARAADWTASLFRILILVLPLLGVSTIVSRLIIAGQKLREAFYYQVGFNIILLILTYCGVESMNAIGYPLALVTMHVLNIGFAYFLLRMIFPSISYRGVAVSLARTIILNGIGIFALKLLGDLLFADMAIVKTLVCGTAYFGALLLVNKYAGFNEDIPKLWSSSGPLFEGRES